jgi:predicted outer membrane repeat protein
MRALRSPPGLRNLFLRRTRCWLLSAALVAPAASAQGIWHVDDDAPAGGDGLSWASAFQNPSEALLVSVAGDTLWVAEGTYRPLVPTNPVDPRSATFLLPNGVSLIGGFEGNEPSLPPQGSALATILTGDLGVPGSTLDNAYHVVTVYHPTEPSIPQRLERCVIRDGRADGLDDPRGGGLLLTGFLLDVSEVTLRDNYALNGGACFAQLGSLRMEWCTFADNSAGSKGGALRAQTLGIDIHNSRFVGNRAIQAGGAVSLTSIGANAAGPDVKFVNCLFQSNSSATSSGGAASMNSGQFNSGKAQWTNCTFRGNRCAPTGNGSAIYAGPPNTVTADSRLRNCIVWGNAPAPALGNQHTVTWSDIQGGVWPGAGNLSADPLLDARGVPALASPAVDAGNNSLLPLDVTDLDGDGIANEPVPLDLLGQRRRVEVPSAPNSGVGNSPLVDMGACEAR